MKPFQVLETDNYSSFSNEKALKFWDEASKKINEIDKKKFEIIKIKTNVLKSELIDKMS